MTEDDSKEEFQCDEIKLSANKATCTCIGGVHLRFMTTVRDDKRVVRMNMQKVIERTKLWSR